MEICDIINETEEGPKDAFRAIKKRIVGNKNFHEVMLALTVLETCVKNCGHRFHVLVSSQDFVEGVLVRTILPKNNPPAIVHDKVLTLIQIGKLRSELEVVNGNMKVMSEMLTELVPSQAEPSDLELLQELNRTCRAMQLRVVELIPRVLHEQLTEELLLINDNLNNVFLRHERFERLRTGQPVKVTQSNSSSAPNEAENSLIDLGPSTPGVRQPEVTNNLSSQLAGMNLGSSSVSAGLHSLDTSGKLEEEFDMFALTRGSSLAEQRREVKYEDPQASKGLTGALDARQQNTGTGESEDAKGVTSEEFDKFLEERAKVADRLPTLSSSSAGTSVSPPAASCHQKQAKEDDAMFAL
ncbi:PREDICTED: target of Myb protein 1 isoform X3 [Fulmarus glacialis]|uniref:target of Myb protein 1 isoform X3 n=1 Tax=Fulmarus glacialis TaxID=30455 RepID=UPI00051C3879|nr:PREDICTED: target of Myb protein 1 isoform X3 [Fulmarus glacialis]